MSGSVACRLQDPGFIERINDLLKKINNNKKFATLMTNSLAAHLCKPGFIEILDELMILLEDKFVTSMSAGVVSRLLKPGYVENLKFWINKLGKDAFATFIPLNAKMLENATSWTILEQWYEKVTREKFHTFMIGGIAACHLLNPSTNEEMCRWFDILELHHFCSIFGSKTIVAHVVKKNQFDRLMEIYNSGGPNKSNDLYKCLRANNWKGARELLGHTACGGFAALVGSSL
jgi:hypothetical protein